MQVIETDREIEEPLLRRLEERIPYVCPEIEEVRVAEGDRTRLLFRTSAGTDVAAAERRLRRLVNESLELYRHVPAERLFTHRSKLGSGGTSPVPPGLTERGPGLVTLSGAYLSAFRYFEALFASWGAELGATERRFSSLIDLETLARAEYTKSFPHHLTYVGHPNDPEVVRSPIEAGDYVLQPAVCFHCYAELSGLTLDNEPWILSAQGRCFRREGLRLKCPERLWEFTMHEIVIVGSADQVEGQRRLLLEKATQLVQNLDLDAVVETANDPFFTNETMGRLVLQRLKALKFELKLSTGDGRPDLAAASFNHHEDFFGTRFAIGDRSGKPAQSGCVAFGLERWAQAYVCRHGEREPPPLGLGTEGRPT
jgi:hypothetical protein